MGEWTWLFTKFPLADIELMGEPIDVKTANVLVRTIRFIPESTDVPQYDVRVAPHNVAPFRGGPWIRRFAETELAHPGQAVADFRAFIAGQITRITSTSPES